MSIIEKAASRIEHTRPRVAPLREHAAAPEPRSTSPSDPSSSASGSAAASAPGARRTREVELDLARMHAAGLITQQGGRSQAMEEFRVIKRPILRRAFAAGGDEAHPGNLVMITSSLAGEGKTHCSVNLAMSIAMELDHTVLLIDADVARPSVLKALGLPPQRGLMDLLLDDKLDLADVLLRTNVNTLTILPAGTSNPHATELLASQAMQTLVREIALRYPDRIVIFDSPPLLLTSEARVLASHMGQIVVVVEAEQTSQRAVTEALRQLEGCDNVSLIYNKTRDFAAGETYDYYYG